MLNKVEKANLLYAKGCNINDADTSGFAEAIEAAKQSDVVVITVGEARDMSGEAKSRSNLQLPGVQNLLIAAIAATGKPVVLLIHAGRPLIFDKAAAHASSVLYTWWLGTEAGNAIADVLYGDYNPSGKLPMTFPRAEGQVPLYYNYFNTGRPAEGANNDYYISSYIDLPNGPAYPFGYGLSYTTFAYSNFHFSSASLKGNQTLTAYVTITNTGNYKGKETVQLYIRDLVGKVVRPVKELKGFQQVELMPGESKTIKFLITVKDLRFYDDQLNYDWEPGEFEIMVGGNSKEVLVKKVNWSK
jgi:beta-glucosidase